jgi:TPR repeat protein
VRSSVACTTNTSESEFSVHTLIYFNGHGVQRNDPEAMKWYRRAADQGDADAQLKIGDMYNTSKAGRWRRIIPRQDGGIVLPLTRATLQPSTTLEFCTLKAKGFRWTMSSHTCGSI